MRRTIWIGLAGCVGTLGLAACGDACPAANLKISDGRAVEGVTGTEVVAQVAPAFDGIAVRWDDGTVAALSGSVTVEPGSARKVNRPDCVPSCLVVNQSLVPCGADVLVQRAQAVLATDDGRLVAGAPWEGTVTTQRDRSGGLSWTFDAEQPAEAVVDTFPALRVAGKPGRPVVAIRVHLRGGSEGASSVSFDARMDPSGVTSLTLSREQDSDADSDSDSDGV